jgi:hypothetical protein
MKLRVTGLQDCGWYLWIKHESLWHNEHLNNACLLACCPNVLYFCSARIASWFTFQETLRDVISLVAYHVYLTIFYQVCVRAQAVHHHSLVKDFQVHASVSLWDLWWTKWCWDRFLSKFFWFPPVSIIPPWHSLHMYHLGDEQRAHWWLQFRDIVSPWHEYHILSLCKASLF